MPHHRNARHMHFGGVTAGGAYRWRPRTVLSSGTR